MRVAQSIERMLILNGLQIFTFMILAGMFQVSFTSFPLNLTSSPNSDEYLKHISHKNDVRERVREYQVWKVHLFSHPSSRNGGERKRRTLKFLIYELWVSFYGIEKASAAAAVVTSSRERENWALKIHTVAKTSAIIVMIRWNTPWSAEREKNREKVFCCLSFTPDQQKAKGSPTDDSLLWLW